MSAIRRLYLPGEEFNKSWISPCIVNILFIGRKLFARYAKWGKKMLLLCIQQSVVSLFQSLYLSNIAAPLTITVSATTRAPIPDDHSNTRAEEILWGKVN